MRSESMAVGFSSREEYGLLAVMRLAMNEGAGPLQAREIARLETLPESFLQQLLSLLTRAGITRSMRGAFGGYELAHPASSVTVGEVVRALSGDTETTFTSPRRKRPEADVLRDLHDRMRRAAAQVLDSVTIESLVEERSSQGSEGGFMMNI